MARAYRRTSRVGDFVKAIVAVALVLCVFSVTKPLFSRETTSVFPFSFSLGKINADGTVSDSETSICSDFILCDGLKIKFNTEREAVYWVFYYDANKGCIGNSGKLSHDYEKTGFEGAKYARIFIVPELKEDQTKIRKWEVFAYANVLEITVHKNQTEKVNVS